MDGLSIRTATLDDHRVIGDVFRRAALSQEQDRPKLLADPGLLVFDSAPLADGRTRVAVRDGHVIGFATLAIDDDGLELEDLFVEPAWMRHGVGRALVDDAVAAARAAGIARLHVTANVLALAFYEAVGFVTDRDVSVRFGVAARMHLDVSRRPVEPLDT